jgi:hypothetical protein
VPQFNGYTISAINYHLIGVRDYGTRFRWVPCASCMAPELTDPAPIIRPFGFFLHAVVNDTKNQLLEADPDIPFIDNFADFSEAIRFIGESETLITNSFHGAYWAALMGRKVIGIPTASKFFSFRHPVPLADIADWRSVLPKTFCYTDALEECRAANLSFAFDVHAALAD